MNTNDKLAEAEILAMCLDEWGHHQAAASVRKGEDLESYEEDLKLIRQLRRFGVNFSAAPAPAVEAPTGAPLRAWTEQERQDAQDAMRKIVDSELQLIDERDHAHDIIDKLCDAILGPDRQEWSSAYFFENAVEDVEEEIARLKKQSPAAVDAVPTAWRLSDGSTSVLTSDRAYAELWASHGIQVTALFDHPQTVKINPEPVCWARPEDLNDDGYGHIFKVYQSSIPFNATVPLYTKLTETQDEDSLLKTIAELQKSSMQTGGEK